MPLPPIENFVHRFLGEPCWGVRRVDFRILGLEFGEPHKVVWPARRRGPRQAWSRRVRLRGEFSLWVGYDGGWRLLRDGEELTDHRASYERMERAVRELEGQAILGVEVDAAAGASRFRFDLGATLETFPREGEPVEQQWSLRLPGGDHLAYRSDGRASLGRGGPEEKVWHAAR